MTFELKSRRDLGLDAVHRVAWRGEGVRFHPDAVATMTRARGAFLDLLESDPELVVYGVTSGYGQMAHLRFTPEERRDHARMPPIAPMTSFGEPLPERVARAMVLARLANFAEGHAAISPPLAEAVAAMLDGPLPPVPALGNGCPGEIQALAHLFGSLAEGFELGEKDAIALVNGSPCANALLADAVLAARGRLAVAIEVFALSYEAINAPFAHLDPVLEEFWEDRHEAGVLRALRGWLAIAGDAARRAYQAPVSWRILPRVLGQAARALAQAEEVAEVSLRAVSDNPVFVPPESDGLPGRVLSNGGYHNAMAYPAMDNLAAAWADLTLLADRHVNKLLDGRTSHLPDYLMGAEGGYPGCLGFTAAAYAEQARHAAQRSFLPGSEGGGFGQNDVALPTFFSWRREAEAGACLEAGLAVLCLIASQALHVTGRPPPPPLRPLLEQIRRLSPPIEKSRGLAHEAEAVKRLLTEKIFAGVRAVDGVAEVS